MAVLDFPPNTAHPAVPAVGEKYPQPPVLGQPVYTWDGEKWTTLGGAIGNTGAYDSIPLSDTPAGGSGSSTEWSRGDHRHPLDTSSIVRYDIAQTPTSAQQRQARQNIYAAPLDALAYNGIQVNGGAIISQETGSTGVQASGYVCDGWYMHNSTTARLLAASAFSTISYGFNNFLYVQPNFAASATLAANDVVVLRQPIEGFRIARLAWGTPNAQPITISFWARHYTPGLYSGSVVNGADNRCYVFTYTMTASEISEYKTVTIPGDTTGTWTADNSIGLTLNFAVACGATFTAPAANAWYASNYVAAPGQVNGVATMSEVFRITGVTVLPGVETPSAERSPYIMRLPDQELITCKRYWHQFTNCLIGIASAAHTLTFPVSMRVTPAVVGGIGGAGFTISQLNNILVVSYQTTPGFANLTLDARM
jgi:hypothetical protein